jgi:hypothetical protein
MNQKQTRTADDPDVESIMEHEYPWKEGPGPERSDRPVRGMSVGLCSPIHDEKAVNGRD